MSTKSVDVIPITKLIYLSRNNNMPKLIDIIYQNNDNNKKMEQSTAYQKS